MTQTGAPRSFHQVDSAADLDTAGAVSMQEFGSRIAAARARSAPAANRIDARQPDRAVSR
jgi:hypothetical protein